MELARALKTLVERRRMVALGALVAAVAALLSVYQVGLFPPSLTSRTNVFATATTQILVDTPDSAFASVSNDIEPLEARASVYARFLASPTAVESIARLTGVPADAVEAQGPYEQGLPEYQQVPTAERRSSQILGERALYRLRFENNPEVPIVSVFAQAPTREEAVALASAAPVALRSYVETFQRGQRIRADRRVEIRRLGSAIGGVVNGGANLQIAALVFLIVFGVWCLLLVPANTIVRGWREGPEEARPSRPRGAPAANGNGNGRVREPRPVAPRRERTP